MWMEQFLIIDDCLQLPLLVNTKASRQWGLVHVLEWYQIANPCQWEETLHLLQMSISNGFILSLYRCNVLAEHCLRIMSYSISLH